MKHQVKKVLTQKERIAEELFSISKDVTEEDRKAFLEKKEISAATISAYLNRKVSNAVLGLEMLVFFRKEIEKREEILKNTK